MKLRRYKGDENLSVLALLRRKIDTYLRLRLDAPQPFIRQEIGEQLATVRRFSIDTAPQEDVGWISACAKHASVIFDVGAHVGDTALLMLQSPSVQHVVLIEANERALRYAAEHLIINHLINRTRLVQAFAADRDDAQIAFYTEGINLQGSIYQNVKNTTDSDDSQHVATVRLDTLAEQQGLYPDFIKIDVEGAEYMVLQGLDGILQRQETRILLEIHQQPDLSMQKNYQQIWDWAQTHALALWHLRTGEKLSATAPPLDPHNDHLLLQPAQWQYPDWLT